MAIYITRIISKRIKQIKLIKRILNLLNQQNPLNLLTFFLDWYLIVNIMNIIFAGGGTGGHLFPGIALAQELLKSGNVGPNAALFLCTDRDFDRRQLDRYKFDYRVLPSPRLPNWRNPLAVAKFLFKMFSTLQHTKRCFKEFNPDVVVGLGGYGAFSSIHTAKSRRLPFVQLEQNVLPGKITRRYCRSAQAVFSQWVGSAQYIPKCKAFEKTGSPIRQEILECLEVSKSDARAQLNLSNKYILLIIGGSQGAESINKLIVDNINVLAKQAHRLSIIHLTGGKDYESMKNTYTHAGIQAVVKSFSDNMGILYAASDFAISRSGGIAITEMAVFGLPMILIPLPTAADNHQYYNGLEVQNIGAGIIVPQDEMAQRIESVIEQFITEPGKFSQNAHKLGNKDSAKIILDKLNSLLLPK